MTGSRILNSPGLFYVILLVAIATAAAARADTKPPRGIIGKDDRKVVPESNTAFRAIGHINVTGFRSKQRCTGTLVAPNRVVTAAHCLVNKRTGMLAPMNHIHFVAGVQGDTYRDHATAKCVRLAKATFKPVPKLSPGLLADMAVVVLEKELSMTPIPLLPEVKAVKNDTLVHLSYPHDRRYALVADFGCRLRGRKYGLWLTDCDTNYASSGGPLLVPFNGQYRLAAIMAGFVAERFTVAVPILAWRQLFLEQACP